MIFSSLLKTLLFVLLIVQTTQRRQRAAPKNVIDIIFVIDNVRHGFMADAPTPSSTHEEFFTQFASGIAKEFLQTQADTIDARIGAYMVGDKNGAQRIATMKRLEDSEVVKFELDKHKYFQEGPLPRAGVPGYMSKAIRMVREALNAESKDENREVPDLLFWFCSNLGDTGASEDLRKFRETHDDPFYIFEHGITAAGGYGLNFLDIFYTDDARIQKSARQAFDTVLEYLKKCEWTIRDDPCNFRDHRKYGCKMSREFKRGAQANQQVCYSGSVWLDCEGGTEKCEENCREHEKPVNPCSVSCGWGTQVVQPEAEMFRACGLRQINCNDGLCPPGSGEPPAASVPPEESQPPLRKTTTGEEEPEETSTQRISPKPTTPEHLKEWHIALIAVGSLTILAIILGILLCCVCKGERRVVFLRRRSAPPKERGGGDRRRQPQSIQRSIDSRGRTETTRPPSSSGTISRQQDNRRRNSPSVDSRRPPTVDSRRPPSVDSRSPPSVDSRLPPSVDSRRPPSRRTRSRSPARR